LDLLHHLAIGFGAALSPENLFYCFVGALLGTFIGVLPGIGPTATVAMLLPITYYLSPTASLIMLAGIYYGSQYGGSTTAILVNLPGEVSSSVTAIDGYQMARQGRAGAALSIAAIGSFVAGTFSTFLIAVVAVPLTSIALKFGPAEYFSLILLGLITSTALAHGSVVKAMAMIITGMLFGIVGTDVDSGAFRFNVGMIQLSDGLSVVAVALGIFGISEVLKNLEKTADAHIGMAKITSLMPSRADLRQAAGAIVRGSLLGSLLGTLPGGGSILSAFSSYVLEKRLSRTPERFGKGAIEGVAGPESANNAGAQRVATTARQSPAPAMPGKWRATRMPSIRARYSSGGAPSRSMGWTLARTSSLLTSAPRSTIGSTIPPDRPNVKQSAPGISSSTEVECSTSPARMPACLRMFSTPRFAIAMLSAVDVPPPPISVVTKTLPISSAAVSYIPEASISSIIIA
jgi:Tripartite tricarboxylate transporter TctA family